MQALQRSLSPQDETFSRSLVRLGGIFVALQSVVLAAAYWLEGAPDWPWRLLANAIACSIGMAAWALERKGRWIGATYVLVWGLWGVIVLAALATGGARSHNQLGLPIILLFCGWVLGRRPALWLLAASLGAIMAFKLAQLWGVMGGLVMTWTSVIYTCGMLVLTVVATLLARQHFMSRAAIAEAAQEQLRASEHELRKLSLAVEQCPASIVITDMQTHVVYANQAFLQRSGYALQEVLGRPTREVSITGMDDAQRQQVQELLAKGQTWQGDLRNRRKDGRLVVEDVRVAPLHDEFGVPTHYVELKQDITDRIKAEATIHQLSHYDRITGLPNRFAFLKRLMELKEQSKGLRCEISPCPRHGLLVLDVDRFTNFNDVHGSVQGDQLLRAVAVCLSGLVPSSGLLVRNSGDEFAIVLENLAVDVSNAELLTKAFAQRLLEALSADPLWLDGVHDGVRVTCCIGMCVFPELANDSEIEALRRANTALHEAKSRGPGHAVIFQEVMAENASRRYRIEKGLRRAVGEGELRLFLQGQYNAEGVAMGVEALVRWENPERGLLSPGAFIPVAEESDLIVLLGDWMLEQTCRLLVRPELVERRLQLSVNVSARQFLQTDFVAKLQALLAFTEADPSRLTLEVTEGLVLGDFDEAAHRMLQLREMGIQFALDDFGTGYSSMAYLKRLPIQELKIDQSFVRDMNKSQQTEALVEAILWVAHRFGLRVVAEGVETPAQAALLHAWEPKILCQGFLYDQPIPWQAWVARYVQQLQPPVTDTGTEA